MTARTGWERMSPEEFHVKCGEGLLVALERGELELHPRLLGEFLERGPEPVLELTWGLRERPAQRPIPGLERRTEAQAEPCVDHVHRFGGGYFASSIRGRSGPFVSMEQALLALTGECGIPVTSALARIRSTEWTEGEIRERMRIVDPPAAPAVEGRPADEAPPPPSPWSSEEGAGLPVDGAPHPHFAACRAVFERALANGDVVLDWELVHQVLFHELDPVFEISCVSHEIGFGTWDGSIVRLGSVYLKQFEDMDDEGPFDSLEEALGEFIITDTLSSVWCSEWSAERLIGQMRPCALPPRATINGEEWTGELIELVHERQGGKDCVGR